jgi:beta-lactamase class A
MAPIAVNFVVSRRAALTGATLLLPLPAAAQASLAALEPSGARVGVAALDTGSGKTLRYRADERFLMCSTFKLALAAAILRRVEHGEEKLDRLVRYTKTDLLPVSFVTTPNLATGLTVEALCAAIIHVSDNTAANLLLHTIGGPAGLTAFLRDTGDAISRQDRTETDLNIHDGDKDTTTPDAFLATLRKLLLGPVLQPASREKLIGWMQEVTTGTTLLRAGFPADWQAGDKTGRGANGEINDLAIIRPPGRAPILVCAYTQGGTDATLAAIGRQVAAAFL